MGIFRSDYIVHQDQENQQDKDFSIKQVEFNTVSVSFGSLSSKVSQLHTYLSESNTYGSSAAFLKDNTRVSKSIDGLADGLAVAHNAYLQQNYPTTFAAKKCIILFIVQPNERNVFDQRHIEYSLYNKHGGITSHRLTLAQVRDQTELVRSELNGKIVLTLVYKPTRQEVSVVYYRSAYAPTDFPSQKEWDARVYLETSHAIKCPTLLTQLSGAKKVQQILTDRSVVEKFLLHNQQQHHQQHEHQDHHHHIGNKSSEIDELMQTFVKLYPMDNKSPEGALAHKLALETPEKYVLKPQREGGGNNIYKDSIPQFLESLPKDKWAAYILMELITPPEYQNKILRNGEIYCGNIVSELGIFGSILWNSQTGEILSNEESGWLLRSKLQSSNEGGVAAGFGCIDSVYLF